ncbi:MAG: hypothetical protein JST85_09720 [Acidobacteria bacterium]|nr:hypothetical protein [Acidobacteriota bacterium]
MIAVQATYDGKEFKPLPSERLPDVKGEVPVAIVFLHEGTIQEEKPDQGQNEKRKRLLESALRLRAQRDAMEPLGMTVAELLEESRNER